MYFENLEDRMLYYRSLTDYKLMPNSYIIVMLDGRSFSKIIKNKYKKPFDKKFVNLMNNTAKYICENVSGCKMAYTQSDEISLLITDFDTPTTDSFFKNRLCKLQSIIASMATAKFNQLVTINMLNEGKGKEDIENMKLVEFDCKAWNVPTYNDAFAWFLYRQNDCIRNSKQQTTQTYLSHKELQDKNVDEQLDMLFEYNGIDWHDLSDDVKYGRFIKKIEMTINDEHGNYIRNKWQVFDGFPLCKGNFEKFFNSIPKL